MARKVLLWISVVMNVVSGGLNLLVPAVSAQAQGASFLSGNAVEILRFVGALQVAIALLSYLALNVTSSDGRRAIDLFMTVGYGLGVLFFVYEAAIGTVGGFAYVQTILPLVLTIAFATYAFRRSEAGQQPAKRASGQ